MRTLYFDCFCGAAGDMIVGALIDVGADFDRIRDGLDSLGVSGYSVAAEKVNKHGTMATQFRVNLDDEHDHPHRHLRHIVEIIEQGTFPDTVKQASVQTFENIAQCEAEVHGTTPEKIHFHEVGAVDSIVDIVGAHLALDQLRPERIVASSLNLGSGTVKCAHGIMPVPAPATALLLKGVPSYSSEVKGELTTPTGAALIGQLATEFGPMPEMTIDSVGAGSGTRDLPDRPNVLRVLYGEAVGAGSQTETIVVIEANIDDMNPELFPPLINDLIEAGCRDAFLTPILGKKGRPAHLVTILAPENLVDKATAILFRGSTTLGLRMRHEQRICLAREHKCVATPWGEVSVKVSRYKGEVTNSAPEHEDCAAVARAAGVPVLEVYQAAYAAAIRGEFKDA